ncbi:MAG: SIS domain-containing protein [Fidelibacterota bacterium]|nr:MAG: SIS domain-containing protein [Candidatus Neomarinimicrobiota bacterium]
MHHATFEEILSQPTTWDKVLEQVSRERSTFQKYLEELTDQEVIFIGCGTSYYLSLSAASLYTRITGKRARASSASEVLFYPETVFPASGTGGYAPVFISRSGETTEVVRAAKEVQTRLGGNTYGVSCRPNSSLIHICDYPLLVPDADEKSVVMTRSFTSMLLLIQLMTAITSSNAKFESELSKLPDLGIAMIDKYRDSVKDIINDGRYSKFIYLAQGPYYGLASEAMLKIKEMSLSSSEVYYSLEFRHGPMATVDEDMLITFFISEHVREEEVALLREMKKLGASTLALCEAADASIRKVSDHVIELASDISDDARMVLYMPVVQLLGYYNAVAKGLDPDHPNNLVQVVTLR